MSIQVKNLSKIYSSQKAVNNISFTVNEGEIVGFLGPNGAGKSTTMKILSCFIPPTGGSATVGGYDVNDAPGEVKKRIGYLPENNPLYKEMYIKEYLAFVARIHGIRSPKERIKEIIEQTGLTVEQKKKIGQLSKGYRQRVGLAQAMIHDPEVLILDEPTTGLDPNQLAEIRELIRNIGKEKTVLLSTHIMQEVEALCDRVIIINKGQLVANDSTSTLQRSGSEQIYTFEFSKTVDVKKLAIFLGESDVEEIGKNSYLVRSKESEDKRAMIFKFAVENNLILLGLQKVENKLEDVFRELTKLSDTDLSDTETDSN